MMSVTLTIKQVPDELAARLRVLAARNHRSLQGELMHTLQSKLASGDAQGVAETLPPAYVAASSIAESFAQADSGWQRRVSEPVTDDLLNRLQTIVGTQGIDTTQCLSRDEAHARTGLAR
jgi:plasmid stability protein